MIQLQWLRRFIRRTTKEIPEARADIWKRRLSYVYAIVAWNAFGFVVYNCYAGNNDWAKRFKSDQVLGLTPAKQWTQTLKIKDATVYKVSGAKYTKYEIHNEVDEEGAEKQEN